MKKITITMYVNDGCPVDSTVKEFINLNKTIPELIDVKEYTMDDGLASNYVLIQSEMWRPFQTANGTTESTIVKLIQVDDDNRESIMDEIYNFSNSYLYTNKNLIEKQKFIAINNSSDSYYNTKKCFTIDTTTEEGINYLNSLNAKSLINHCSRLYIKKVGEQYFGLVKNLEPEYIFESVKIDGANAANLKEFLSGNIYSRKLLDENNEIYDYCVDTIKNKLDETTCTEYYYNNVFNMLLLYGLPSIYRYNGKEYDSSPNVVAFKWNDYINLVDKVLAKTPRNMFVKSLGKFLYVRPSTQEFNDYSAIVKYMMKSYGLISDEEINYASMNDCELEGLDRMKYAISNAVLNSINFITLNDNKSSSWNLDLYYSTLRRYNSYLRENKDTFVEIYNNLSDDEKDELFIWIKRMLSRIIILKELPNISYILFESCRILEKVGDYDKRFLDTILNIFNEYKGMEVMTIRSIVNNNIFINGESIFNNVTKDMKKLKKIVFESKIKQD